MRNRHHLCLAILLVVSIGTVRAELAPDEYGYVTRVASPSDFDVDGLHVVLSPAAHLDTERDGKRTPISGISPFVGQLARIWGHIDRKALTIMATHLVLYDPRPYVVSGSAIIDLIPPAPAAPGSTQQVRRIRADGRTLEISNTILDHPLPDPGAPPPVTLADLHTNVWIDYNGLRRPDGVVTLDRASFAENKIVHSEDKFRKKHDYDPAVVPDDAHQSGWSKAFKGTDVKQIPPAKDSAMQSRIDRIGNALIPAFQRALPESDPTRIHFRFQLVDEPKWHDAITMPSGVILVPRQIVDRLPDDSVLAAVLADNIATALERQSYRQQTTIHQLTAAQVAGDVAGIFVPGVGIATAVANYGVGKHMLNKAEQQSGRVALALMYDAGYDIDKAPEAWWTLATRPGQDPHGAVPPERAMNQYDELGTTWQPANRRPLGQAISSH